MKILNLKILGVESLSAQGRCRLPKVAKSRSHTPYSLVQTLLLQDISFSHNGQSQTEGQATLSCQQQIILFAERSVVLVAENQQRQK